MRVHPVKNNQAEFWLRNQLYRLDEWTVLNAPKKNGETGTDIVAQMNGDIFFIEVIGYKARGPSRSKDFFEGFWRTISRLEEDNEQHYKSRTTTLCTKIVLAVPNEYKRGMKLRIKQYATAWSRIANAFPELEIWFVSETNFDRCPWGNPV